MPPGNGGDGHPGQRPPSALLALLARLPGPSLFEHRTGQEALGAIAETEVTVLLQICAEYCRAEALLIDTQRLCNFLLSALSDQASRGAGAQSFEPWVYQRLVEAGRELVLEDELAPGPSELEDRYGFAAATFLIPLEDARRACAAFNGLERETRRAFFDHLLDGKPIEESESRRKEIAWRLRLASRAVWGTDDTR